MFPFLIEFKLSWKEYKTNHLDHAIHFFNTNSLISIYSLWILCSSKLSNIKPQLDHAILCSWNVLVTTFNLITTIFFSWATFLILFRLQIIDILVKKINNLSNDNNLSSKLISIKFILLFSLNFNNLTLITHPSTASEDGFKSDN